MDDVLKTVIGIGMLALIGVFSFGAVVFITVQKRRALGRTGGLPPGELEALQPRIAAVDLLDARVNELEERLDFAERLIAQQQHETERLPGGPALDH